MSLRPQHSGHQRAVIVKDQASFEILNGMLGSSVCPLVAEQGPFDDLDVFVNYDVMSPSLVGV
jgi:hypothetical protein